MPLSEFDLINLLPRSPEKRSTTELLMRLSAGGHTITARSLQRRLMRLSTTHPLVCDERSKPFGWSIRPDAPSTIGAMSVQEAVTLKLAERYLTEAIPADLLDDLKSYFNEADAKLKSASLYRAWLGKVRLLPANQPLLKPEIKRQVIKNAYAGVLKGVVLHVTYRVRDGERTKSYDIEPLAIVVRGHVSYLVAQFPWADDVTLMALHRFSDIRLTDAKIRAGLGFDLDAYIDSGALGFMPAPADKVQLHFYDYAGDHLAETPISVNQVLKKGIDGEQKFNATLPITEQFKWWLLAFGDRVEVVSPVKLRNEIRERLVAATKRYVKTEKT